VAWASGMLAGGTMGCMSEGSGDEEGERFWRPPGGMIITQVFGWDLKQAVRQLFRSVQL
jgi:hypothetical protein